MNIAAQILDVARDKGILIAAAESCTGGMVAAALTDLPGSSDVFDRGFVTYSNAAKRDMLGVSQATLDAHGAVSQEVAIEMANGALAHSAATIAIAITGIAGPGGSEHKPEGRVCFAAGAAGAMAVEIVEFGARGRDRVRAAARDHALLLILQAIRKLP